MPKKILLIDCSAICYAAHYTCRHLTTRASMPTGVIYGFFVQFYNLCLWNDTANAVFLWDSRQSLRRLLFPEYKAQRLEKSQEILDSYVQFDRLRKEILPRLEFDNTFMKIGYEADDLIASVCVNNPPRRGQKYVIVSNDKDLYQLIRPNISMWKPQSSYPYYGYEEFKKEWKIEPQQWAEVKAIAGCKTDNVPGIVGVAEKTASKYILGTGNRLIDNRDAQRIIKRNRPLVALPFKNTPKLDLCWDYLPSIDEWKRLCEEFEFNSFIRNWASWERIFNGRAPDAVM